MATVAALRRILEQTREDEDDRIESGLAVPNHKGRHHFARCGEWSPLLGNHDCPLCPARCPMCKATDGTRRG